MYKNVNIYNQKHDIQTEPFGASKVWKKPKYNSLRTNSSLLITQSKLVYKTRKETLNDSLVPAVVNDSGQLKKGNVSFSQLKRTATKKLMNSGDAFSNYVNVESKVDEAFIADNHIARKKKNSYAEAVRRYDNTKRALPIYAQTQQRFLIVRIR